MAKKKFLRDNSFRHKRVGKKWRKPKGKQNKRRRHFGSKAVIPKIGYGSPADERHLHPSGLEDVLVSNVNDLEGLEPEKHAVRVEGSVGLRKRSLILKAAEKKNLRLLNVNESKVEKRKKSIERNKKQEKAKKKPKKEETKQENKESKKQTKEKTENKPKDKKESKDSKKEEKKKSD